MINPCSDEFLIQISIPEKYKPVNIPEKYEMKSDMADISLESPVKEHVVEITGYYKFGSTTICVESLRNLVPIPFIISNL